MPVISPYTTKPVAMGFAEISTMGAIPPPLVGQGGNNAHWLNSHTLVYQAAVTGGAIRKIDLDTNVVTTLDASAGGNLVGGGADVWAAWLAGVGVRTSVGGFGPFPEGSLGDFSQNPTLVSELGQVLLIDFGTSQIKVYTALGALQWSVTTMPTTTRLYIRQNIVSYQDMAGWHLVNVTTGAPVAGFQSRPNIIRLVPFTIGSAVGVLEYDSAAGTLSVRNATQLSGLIIPTVGTEFNPDVQGVDSSHVRVAWSLTQGEAPADLVIMDINVNAGTTSIGTVVSGAVVFADGPVLEGTRFDGSTAGGNRLPVQSQKLVNPDGTITKPWRDALQDTNNGVQSATTQIANIPVSVSAPSFSTIGGVTAPSANATLALTSADASVTFTANQGAQSIDLSVVASGAGVPYFVPPATTFTIPVNIQGLWTMPIDVEGTLVVDGYLVEVT